MNISIFYDHLLQACIQTNQPILEIMQQATSFGIHGLECDWNHIKGQESQMESLLSHSDMFISCIYATFDLGHNPDDKAPYALIDTAALFHCTKVLIIPGFIKPGTIKFLKTRQVNRMAKALNKLCDYAEEKNISVTLEDFDDVVAPFSTDDELVWFMTHVPKLYCTFDTGNFKYQEIDELQAFEKLKDRIIHVHCKDRLLTPLPYASHSLSESPKKSVTGTSLYSSPVGTGCIPMTSIFSKLKELNYNGTFAIEHFGSPNQLDYMKQSAHFIVTNYR